jgi:putative transposase
VASLLASAGGEHAGLRLLTVETIFMQQIYVLFFISLATRRIEYVASSSKPDGRWVAEQARNLVMQFGDEQPFRFLIHDRDTKFSHAFDEVFRAEGIKVIRTPVQAPNANAFAERWVRTVRADCLDRILILGRRHLEHVLSVYRPTTTNTGHTALSNCSRRTAVTRRR